MENNNPCLFTIKQPLLQRIFPLIIHPPEIEYTVDGSEAEKQNGEKWIERGIRLKQLKISKSHRKLHLENL